MFRPNGAITEEDMTGLVEHLPVPQISSLPVIHTEPNCMYNPPPAEGAEGGEPGPAKRLDTSTNVY